MDQVDGRGVIVREWVALLTHILPFFDSVIVLVRFTTSGLLVFNFNQGQSVVWSPRQTDDDVNM